VSDRYAVIGNPIAHSRSPAIHAAFARQTGEDLIYERLLAPVDGFVAAVDAFRSAGGRGLNVTLPFKLDAFRRAGRLSERARAAGAVNTLRFDADAIFGDNTDGIGLVTDIAQRLRCPLAGRTVLLLGAGGAARGVILPLLAAGVARLTVLNRTPQRAHELVRAFVGDATDPRLDAGGFDRFEEPAHRAPAVDVIVNGTSSGLAGEAPPVPAGWLARAGLVYDMVYGARPTPLMTAAAAAGCGAVSDGLGMLVEQAAESFALWRGVRPDTAPVYALLRASLAEPA